MLSQMNSEIMFNLGILWLVKVTYTMNHYIAVHSVFLILCSRIFIFCIYLYLCYVIFVKVILVSLGFTFSFFFSWIRMCSSTLFRCHAVFFFLLYQMWADQIRWCICALIKPLWFSLCLVHCLFYIWAGVLSVS